MARFGFKQLVQDGDFYEYLEQFGDTRTRVPLTDYSASRVFIGGQKPDLQYAAIQTKPKNLDEAIEQVEFKLSKLASKPSLAYKHNSRHQIISFFTPKDTQPAYTQNAEPEQINPKTPTLPENHSKSRKTSPRGMLLV